MNDIAKTTLSLTAITVVASLCLGIVSEVTKAPIAAQNKKTQDEAMAKVMASADEFQELTEAPLTGTISSVSAAYQGGEQIGYVVSVNPSGFGGTIGTMVGVDMDGAITGLTVTSLSESPGLGSHAQDADFQEQFVGLTAPIAVTKDNGQIQAITSATITSRAVSSGATEACEWVLANGGAH